MKQPVIDVVGMGVDGVAPASAASAIAASELVLGSQRHLSTLTGIDAELRCFPSPFSDFWPLLESHAGRRVVVLASGDPLLYGIGSSLLKRYPSWQMVFHPNVSSVQQALAAARQDWQQTTVVSLHGRPLDSLRRHLRVNRVYACLTDGSSHPAAVAELLVDMGYPRSTLWVAEDLGSESQRFSRFEALRPPRREFSALNVLIIHSLGPGGKLPEFPGIPDTWFSTDSDTPGRGMISKREMRLAALSLLSPRAGDLGWDVGAGCGGLCIEWARWNPQGRVVAVEQDGDRVRHIQENRHRFGVGDNLEIVHNSAPEALVDLPDPDSVYIGGSDGRLDELLEVCWRRLKPGGRLVAAAVTEESRAGLRTFAANGTCHFSQIAVAHETRLGQQHALRPNLPVLLMQRIKN